LFIYSETFVLFYSKFQELNGFMNINSRENLNKFKLSKNKSDLYMIVNKISVLLNFENSK